MIKRSDKKHRRVFETSTLLKIENHWKNEEQSSRTWKRIYTLRIGLQSQLSFAHGVSPPFDGIPLSIPGSYPPDIFYSASVLRLKLASVLRQRTASVIRLIPQLEAPPHLRPPHPCSRAGAVEAL